MAKDMTSGRPVKMIVAFAIPVFIGNLFQQFYNIVDTMIVGRFVGVNALAAVGSTSSIMFCVQGLASGLMTGFGVVIAQSFVAKDEKGLRHYVVMSKKLTLLLSVAITVFLVICNRPLLKIMNTPDYIFDGAYTYLFIIFAGFIAMMTYNLFAAILRAIGDSRTPLYFLILSSALNVVLDLVFVINFQMGVAGVAYATVISQAVSAVLCLVYMMKKYPQIMKSNKEEAVFSLRSAVKLMGMGIPMALQFSITALGTMIVQSTLKLLGETAIAAYCGQNAGARAFLIKIIGTNFGYAGICFCDPAAWIAALIPLIPLYYYRMKKAEMRIKGITK